jgi:hypothetical protein
MSKKTVFSDSKQESNECEADLEQQKAYELIFDLDLNSSTLAECSRERYECEFYDQFANQVEPMGTSDCIGNYIFLVDLNSYDFNTVLSSSSENVSEEEVVMIDDQNLRSRE